MKRKLTFFATAMALCWAISLPAANASHLLGYDFDEASGNALDNGSAPLTDATFEGGAVRSSDTPSGTGSSLDLRNDDAFAHLLGSDAADLDGLGALTLTTWLKVADYTSGNNRLVAKQTGGSFGGFSLNMNATTNDGVVGPDNFRLALFLGGDTGFDGAFSDADVDASDWAFIAATYDSADGSVSYYTGGVGTPVSQLGTTQILGTNPGVIDGLTARFAVGLTDAAPTADTSVNGWQDDVRVYGEVLTLEQLESARLSNVIPEPATLALAGFALVGSLLRRSRK